ncbi:MAG: type II secretion system protein [bacterium]|nr:type II secretion system protein [bacterium]
MKYKILKIGMENGEWRIKIPHSPFPIPHSTQRGFTLVETLIAISILLVAVVTPISLIGDSLHKLYYARDEMVAINLAQEGIEVVRYVRDSNLLASVPWTKGLHNSNEKNGYIVDAASISGATNSYFKKCNGNNTECLAPQPIYFDSATGFYSQGLSVGGTVSLTQFKRLVTTEDVSGNVNEIKVTSTVEWMTGGQAGSIVVTENLFKLK